MKHTRIGLLAALLLVAGCSGSTNSEVPTATAEHMLVAALPNGSQMLMDVDPDAPGDFEGGFSSFDGTSGDAPDYGACFGTVKGNQVTVGCLNEADVHFEMTGKQADGGYDLVRSDMPGTELHFRPLVDTKSRAVAHLVFNLSFGPADDEKGLVDVSGSPSSNPNGASVFTGKWRGKDVVVTAYGSGGVFVDIAFSPFQKVYVEFPGSYTQMASQNNTARHGLAFADRAPDGIPEPDSEVLIDLGPVTSSPAG